MGFTAGNTIKLGSGLLKITIAEYNIVFIDSLRKNTPFIKLFLKVFYGNLFLGCLSGTLASQSIRFNLPLSKGLFPHLFCQEKNFNYLGEVPENEFYLSFGETTPKQETLEYLAERQNSGE